MLADSKHLALAQALYDGGTTDIATICQTLGISRTTLYRSLRLDRKTHGSDGDGDDTGESPPPRGRRSRGLGKDEH